MARHTERLRWRVLISAIGAIVLAGCVDPIAPDSLASLLWPISEGHLQFQGRLRNDSAFILVRNTTSVTDTITWSPCSFAARLYGGPTFHDRVWQSIPDTPLPCADVLGIRSIAPGDSALLRVTALTAAPAHGQVHVYLVINTTLFDFIAGMRDIPALLVP